MIGFHMRSKINVVIIRLAFVLSLIFGNSPIFLIYFSILFLNKIFVMKIMLTGSNGLLGQKLIEKISKIIDLNLLQLLLVIVL